MQAQPTFGKRGIATPQQGTAIRTADSSRIVTRTTRAALAPVVAPTAPLDIAAATEYDMKLAIGRNWEKYRPVWENLDAGFPETSFARAGFLFGVLWLLYRKQYSAFFVGLMAQMAIGYVAPGNTRWLNLTVSVLVALIGKWWITRNAALMVVRIRSLGLPEAETEERIRRQGGVSWLGPIVVLFFSFAVGAAMVIARASHIH
jgi:hypothetical protein